MNDLLRLLKPLFIGQTPLRSLLILLLCALSTAASAQVSGVVIDSSNGNPIDSAIITLQTTTQRTESATDGTFTLAGVSGTSLVIAGAKKGYYNGAVTVTTPATSIQIELDPVPVSDDPNYSFVIPDQCSVCHPDQFTQWDSSRMAHTGLNSWVYDLFDGTGTPGGSNGFVYLNDSVHAGADPSGHCAACHQPEGWISNPLQPLDPLSGPLTDAQRRGVSCETCHKIADVDETMLNATGFVPGAVTVTRPDTSGLVEQVMYGLLGDVDFNLVNQMRGSYQPQLAAEACAVCLEYNNDPDHDNDFEEANSVPAQETYSEWKNSPYGDPSDPLYKSCVDCHMPQYSDVPIESCAALFPPLLRDPTTVRGHDIDGTSPTYLENAVTMSLASQQVGNELVVDVQITNDQTGHSVPTGVTLRNMILKVTATGPGAQQLSQSSGDVIGAMAGIGDPSSGNFAGLAGKLFAKTNQDAAGNQGVLFTEATTIISDTRIAALATDLTTVAFDITGIIGDVDVEARLIYRRASRELVSAKGWTTDGLGGSLADVQAPDFGHLMESSAETVAVSSTAPPFLFRLPELVVSSDARADIEVQQVNGSLIDCGGLSFGIRTLPSLLAPTGVVLSDLMLGLNGGTGPAFNEVTLFADGITSAVVFDFQLQETLSFSTSTTVATAHYDLVGLDPASPPAGNLVYFADDLGIPQVSNVVSSSGGQAYYPAFQNADSVTILDSPLFTRGDGNGDGLLDIGDAVFTLGVLFSGLGPAPCDDSCDANDDGMFDIGDPVRTLSFLFAGASPLPAPTHPDCAADPTDDSLGCDFDTCP